MRNLLCRRVQAIQFIVLLNRRENLLILQIYDFSALAIEAIAVKIIIGLDITVRCNQNIRLLKPQLLCFAHDAYVIAPLFQLGFQKQRIIELSVGYLYYNNCILLLLACPPYHLISTFPFVLPCGKQIGENRVSCL